MPTADLMDERAERHSAMRTALQVALAARVDPARAAALIAMAAPDATLADLRHVAAFDRGGSAAAGRCGRPAEALAHLASPPVQRAHRGSDALNCGRHMTGEDATACPDPQYPGQSRCASR